MSEFINVSNRVINMSNIRQIVPGGIDMMYTGYEHVYDAVNKRIKPSDTYLASVYTIYLDTGEKIVVEYKQGCNPDYAIIENFMLSIYKENREKWLT